MAQTPEKKVKNEVVKLLKQYGVYYFFPLTYGMGRSGVPDIICCINSHFLGIECKAGKNSTTTLQDRELDLIAAAGGISVVTNRESIEALEALIRTMKLLGTYTGGTLDLREMERLNDIANMFPDPPSQLH